MTDSGSCYRACGLRRYIASRPEFEHVRTRHRSPETNGVIARWFQSLKYEHLYLHELDDGLWRSPSRSPEGQTIAARPHMTGVGCADKQPLQRGPADTSAAGHLTRRLGSRRRRR